MFYIYILYSEKTDVYYIGQTNDLERRLNEHNSSIDTKFTNRHYPWKLQASFEIGEDRSLAIKVEHHIKKQKSKKYIKDLIDRGTIEKIIERYR
jgi:putative endonuclease